MIACVWRTLKPGGRFVAEFGGKGNVATLISGLFDALRAFDQPVPKRLPWYFPSPAAYATLLEAQGFRVAYLAHFAREAPLAGPDAIANYLRQYTPEYLDAIPPEQQAAFVPPLRISCARPSTATRAGGWTSCACVSSPSGRVSRQRWPFSPRYLHLRSEASSWATGAEMEGGRGVGIAIPTLP